MSRAEHRGDADRKQPRQAWEYEEEFRLAAVPPPLTEKRAVVPRHTSADDTDDTDDNDNTDGNSVGAHSSDLEWTKKHALTSARREQLLSLWDGRVPGSLAPERLNVDMVQAWANRGYDVSRAEELLPLALEASRQGDWSSLEYYSAQIRQRVREAPKAAEHEYWRYEHPDTWEAISALAPRLQKQQGAMPPRTPTPTPSELPSLRSRIEGAWWGQVAAASWGAALEGYRGEVLVKHFGTRLNGYLTMPPDTYNDDIVYELAFLSACETFGRQLTSTDIAFQWVRMIPHGWSAEQRALENIREGYLPPLSASHDNPFSEWIGGQMRGMVCGLVSPHDPSAAAYLAWLDGQVSHQGNGIYGEMYAAVTVSLSFHTPDPRRILIQTIDYLPTGTWFHRLYSECLDMCRVTDRYQEVWADWSRRLRRFNWIHTFPNMIATMLSLWYGEGDFSKSLHILAHCGLDVDCNGGLVGSVLGAISHPPAEWRDPISSGIDTYLPSLPHIDIASLTDWTMRALQNLAISHDVP